jgi:flotillin
LELAIMGACLGLGAGVGFILLVAVAKQFLYVSRPNEILIFSGRSYKLPDGTELGYRVIHGGWAWRIPVLEKVDRMDLTTMPIDIQVTNAYSKGGIPLAVHAIANVKVSSIPGTVNNSIERFMGRDPEEIRRVAKESLEGQIRGVLARMTPEEVNEDRLKFAEEMIEEAGEDFNRLGLRLDTLKVQSVSDDVSYLDSLGRERLAGVLSDAEIAESHAKADAEQEQARAIEEGKVADEQAETEILQGENALRQVKAELEATAKSAEERAEQGAIAARARAEHKLQELRTKLEHLRLMSDVVLPAEAQRKQQEFIARAQAAQIAADGEAMAEVLRLMTETWLKAGDDAREIFLIQQLEQVIQTVAQRVQQIQIDEVVLLDGGDGTALPAHIAALPATVSAILREFKETTGVDVPAILSGDTVEVSR